MQKTGVRLSPRRPNYYAWPSVGCWIRRWKLLASCLRFWAWHFRSQVDYK